MKSIDKAIRCLDVKYPENQKQVDAFVVKLNAASKQMNTAYEQMKNNRKKIESIYNEFSHVMNYLGVETGNMIEKSQGYSYSTWASMRDIYNDIK